MLLDPRKFILALTLLLSASAFADALTDAVSDANRPNEEKVRDEYRHPQQTLRFFGVQADMTVVEVWPGGGWYSNILAPLLKDNGQYYAAHFLINDGTSDYFKKSQAAFAQKVANVQSFNKVKLTGFDPSDDSDIAPAGSSDAVLTFRNIHNWYMRQGEEGVEKAFATFFKALKKGGVLGVVEHRLPETMADDMQLKAGYMKQSFVIAKAEKAGFTLVASSEINANPLDNAMHPKGVWTLPPSMRLGEEDMAKYLAIGESDRMTLKFVKPE
jgi:predicted methyltransferase